MIDLPRGVALSRAIATLAVVAGVAIGATLISSVARHGADFLDHTPAALLEPTLVDPVEPADPGAEGEAPLASAPGELRIVPAVRDVQVRMGTTVVVSDEEGRLVIPESAPADGPVSIEILGYRASPAVRQVRFIDWADGSTATRRLVDPSRPAPAIRVEIDHRVVATGPGVDRGTVIRFDSPIGPVSVPAGQATWLPSLRPDVDGAITYSYVGVDGDGFAGPPGQRFVARPEARWSLSAGSAPSGDGGP